MYLELSLCSRKLGGRTLTTTFILAAAIAGAEHDAEMGLVVLFIIFLLFKEFLLRGVLKSRLLLTIFKLSCGNFSSLNTIRSFSCQKKLKKHLYKQKKLSRNFLRQLKYSELIYTKQVGDRYVSNLTTSYFEILLQHSQPKYTKFLILSSSTFEWIQFSHFDRRNYINYTFNCLLVTRSRISNKRLKKNQIKQFWAQKCIKQISVVHLQIDLTFYVFSWKLSHFLTRARQKVRL